MWGRNAPPLPFDLTWRDFDRAPLNLPIWTCIFTSVQFYLPAPLSLAATPWLMSLREEKKKRNGMGALILKLCVVTFPAHSRHERPSFNTPSINFQTQLIIYWLHCLAAVSLDVRVSVGQNRGRWSEICCLRETGYYLNRAEAIGGVWEKGMRLRSAVWLEQLLSWGLFKLICTAQCSGEIGLERHFLFGQKSLCHPYKKTESSVWERNVYSAIGV